MAEQFLIDEDDYAAIQNAVQTLEAIAQRQRQICDLIEPVNDIRRAAGLAKYAHSRLEPVLFKLRRSDGVKEDQRG